MSDFPIRSEARLDSERHPYLKATFHQSYRDFIGYHGHTFWEFFLVSKGSYKHNFNGQEEIIRQGEAYLIRPCDHHAIGLNEANSSRLLVTVTIEHMKEACASLSEGLYEVLMSKKALKCSLADHQIRKIVGLCSYVQKELNGDPKKLELPTSLLLFNILSMVIDQNYAFDANKPEWLLEIIRKIQDPANKAWHVSDVMRNVNYSHSHVSRSFQEYMGCSIVDYVSEVKMQNAGDFLTYSDMTVYEISNALGYKSPTNFSAVFKAAYGTSPAQYRKAKKSQKKSGEEPKDLF